MTYAVQSFALALSERDRERAALTVPSENSENSSATAAATDDVGKVLNFDSLKDSTL